MSDKHNVAKMRKELAKKNIYAHRTTAGWMLLKVSVMSDRITFGSGWEYTGKYTLLEKLIKHHEIVLKRSPGQGRGSRPYPRRTIVETAFLRSEEAAYKHCLLMPTGYTWHR